MTGSCPYCKSERYVNEDGGVICDRCGATFLTEENTQDPAAYIRDTTVSIRFHPDMLMDGTIPEKRRNLHRFTENRKEGWVSYDPSDL